MNTEDEIPRPQPPAYPLSIEERQRLEHMMEVMLADPKTDPWDIWRCQQALDGKG